MKSRRCFPSPTQESLVVHVSLKEEGGGRWETHVALLNSCEAVLLMKQAGCGGSSTHFRGSCGFLCVLEFFLWWGSSGLLRLLILQRCESSDLIPPRLLHCRCAGSIHLLKQGESNATNLSSYSWKRRLVTVAPKTTGEEQATEAPCWVGHPISAAFKAPH